MSDTNSKVNESVDNVVIQSTFENADSIQTSKDDILRKARSQQEKQPDEMEQHVDQKASKFALTVGFILCLILMFINSRIGRSIAEIFLIYSVICGIIQWYTWDKLRRKFHLTMAIVWSVAALINLNAYIISLLG